LTELHDAVLLWALAFQAAGALALAPFVDPSTEPFIPFH